MEKKKDKEKAAQDLAESSISTKENIETDGVCARNAKSLIG